MHRLDWPEGIKGFFALAFVLAIFFSYDMGIRPFADPDEGRYVEIPREMVVTGDYVTPRLNGLKYFEKPALFYWMQAASIKAFGINETSMRLWTVIFAILGCLSVFLIGSRYYSNGVGLLSSGILATNILYYANSHLIILDLVLSVFMSGALWCFFAAFVRKDKSPHQHKIIVCMYILSALACLTKGLIGIVLPAFVAFLWVMFTKNWKKIPEMLYVPGIVAFLVVFLPWHIWVISRNSDFFHFYFVVEHFLRYTTTIHARYQPPWFFLPVLLVGFLPWTGFSLVALKNTFPKKQMSSENIFLFCWIFGILGFFSFSSSKLIPYILPIMQPLALITGISIVKSIKSESHSFRNGALINIFLFAIAIAAYFVAKPQISDVLQDPDAQTLIYVFGGVFIAAAIVLLAAAYPNWSHHRRFLINAIILAAAVAAYFLVELNSMLYDFIYVLGVIFIVTAIVLLVATYPKWSRYWRLLNNVILAFTAWFVVVLLIFASDVLQGLNGLAIGVFFALVLVPIAFVLLTIALVFGHLLDNACAAHADSIGYRYNALLLFLFLGANMMWVINKASTYYQDVKKPSTKNMADIIRLNKNKDDLVFCYDRYYQDFPVYLNSTVNIVNFVGELEFGANAEKEKHVIWQDKEFWDFWKTTDKRIFLLISKEKYREVFASKVGMHNILDFDKNFTVISNQRNQRDVGSNNASPTSETYASTIFNAEAASASQRGVGSDNDKTCAASTNMSNK